jgi:hypothetical protein
MVGIQLGGSVKIIRWLHFLHFLMLLSSPVHVARFHFFFRVDGPRGSQIGDSGSRTDGISDRRLGQMIGRVMVARHTSYVL